MPSVPRPNPELPFDAVAVRLSALGDVVLTTGVLRHFHETYGLRFAMITRQDFAPVLTGHPAIPAVVPLKLGDIRHHWMRLCSDLGSKLGGLPLIDLHATGRTIGLSAFWKGSVHRYKKQGFTRRLYRRFGWASLGAKLEALNVPQRYALALDRTPPPPEAVRPHIYLNQDELDAADALLAERGLAPGTAEKPLIALHPYATHPAKAWPEAHWRELIGLLEARGLDWFMIGRAAKPLGLGPRDFSNATNLRASAALIARASALVSADSGPMHLGTAVGTPVLGLFGPTTKAWGFFPSGERDVVLEEALDCRPCSLHGRVNCARQQACLTGIAPQRVLDSLDGLLKT